MSYVNEDEYTGITAKDLVDKTLANIEKPLERWPVIRTGPRTPIPSVVRFSIYRRDGFTCRECGFSNDRTSEGLELDHKIPWSAGGGDHSLNLRTLCKADNKKRSNWNDGAEGAYKPVTTWWCQDCWLHPDMPWDPDPWDWHQPQREYRPSWKNGINLNAAPYVTGSDTQVYCAWCWAYGYSDVAFTEEDQARLAAMVTPEGVI